MGYIICKRRYLHMFRSLFLRIPLENQGWDIYLGGSGRVDTYMTSDGVGTYAGGTTCGQGFNRDGQ